jgi:hypothetical protein
MIVIAPRISPLAIIAGVSPTGTQATSAVSSTSGSPTSSAPVHQVQVLRVVSVADNRLAGHDKLDPERTPTRFLLHLTGRRSGRFLTVVHVATRQLPHPAVHDEPVPAHQQHPLARVIQHHRHRAAPHPEDVLREPHLVRKLDIGQADADVRGVVHQPLAVDHPLGRVSHARDATGLA